MKNRSQKGFTMLELVFVIMILGFLIVAIIIPGVLRANSERKLVSCGGNLKALSEALALYAREHYGMVPLSTSLQSDLEPNFISRIPKCPSSGIDYDYKSDDSGTVHHHMVYTIFCQGSYHTKAKVEKANYPQYTTGAGLDLGNGINPRGTSAP